MLELGGLYVVGTARHESRRVDNQLRGRAGRQGDPGATRFFLSLDDDVFRSAEADSMICTCMSLLTAHCCCGRLRDRLLHVFFFQVFFCPGLCCIRVSRSCSFGDVAVVAVVAALLLFGVFFFFLENAFSFAVDHDVTERKDTRWT